MKFTFSKEPEDKARYTHEFDAFYTRFARLYDWALRWLPFWRRYLEAALPHVSGPRVLELSFGTGYLLTQYAGRFDTYALDYNRRMATLTMRKLRRCGAPVRLQVGDVAHLPYAAESFDTVINTMAFSGYPDGAQALSEIRRVLKLGGRFILVDVNYPDDRNPVGVGLGRLWDAAGDIVRDMGVLFTQFSFEFTDTEIGSWGSIHLYLETKLAA